MGVTGQIGSYFADFLLDKGHEVFGLVRRVSTPNYGNIEHLLDAPSFHIVDGDITDLASLIKIFKEIQPDYIVNQAAQSFVGISWNEPILTSMVTGIGALNVFEAARQVCPKARIYHASSSEMFDGTTYPQNEDTYLSPRSPYGVSKLFAHHMARIYNESYGMYIVTGICFNMESPRRGIEFVTQKIVDAVVKQVLGDDFVLELGNLESKRDWMHAKDAVEMQWSMLNQNSPDTYVIASGETYSIMEFVNKVYEYFDVGIVWIKENDLYVGYDLDGKVLVRSVEKFYRPNEVNVLHGNPSRAKEELGWKPKYNLDSLIKDMIESRLSRKV